MVIRLVGVVALTRIIGPADYGFYAGSVAIVFVVTVLAQMGTRLFLRPPGRRTRPRGAATRCARSWSWSRRR